MRPLQLARITSALETIFDYSAGDIITWVDPEGNPFLLRSIASDTPGEGIETGKDGILDHDVEERLFLKKDLLDAGTTIVPDGYFLKGTERWDFVANSPIQETIVPLLAIHNFVSVRIRKASELEVSTAGVIGYT
jgi:hypothetical protein